MQLLISVADANDARAALAGGAQIVDAKDPAVGALGAVALPVLRAIREVVPLGCPLSAALGDVRSAAEVERAVSSIGKVPLAFVKLGFLGVSTRGAVQALTQSAVRCLPRRRSPGLVLVAYADWSDTGSLDPKHFPEIANQCGAGGILVDTAQKDSGRLFERCSPKRVMGWIQSAHELGLFVGLAGRLETEDLEVAWSLGADVVGVRGAACEGGRTGFIATPLVKNLRNALEAAVAATARAPG